MRIFQIFVYRVENKGANLAITSRKCMLHTTDAKMPLYGTIFSTQTRFNEVSVVISVTSWGGGGGGAGGGGGVCGARGARWQWGVRDAPATRDMRSKDGEVLVIWAGEGGGEGGGGSVCWSVYRSPDVWEV